MKYVPSLFGGGQFSGSAGSNTASRNRFGSYIRTRVIPMLVQNAATAAVRGNLATLSSAWRTLTNTQRGGWSDLGLNITRQDSLGVTYDLTGHQAYISINRNLFTIGASTASDAPAYSPPASVTSVSITATAS